MIIFGPMRLIKWITYAITVAAVIYVLLLAFPQLYFSTRSEHGPFVVHAKAPLDERMKGILDLAAERIARSEFHDPQMKFTIVLCGGQATYSFFAPTARDAFASTYPLLRTIYINAHDPATDKVLRPAPKNNVRSLSGTIAHEAGHVMLEKSLGLLKYRMLPVWLNEGYCDHLAGESSIADLEGRAMFCEGTLDHPYFLGRLRVEHLLAGGSGFDRIVSERPDPALIDDAMRKQNCR